MRFKRVVFPLPEGPTKGNERRRFYGKTDTLKSLDGYFPGLVILADVLCH